MVHHDLWEYDSATPPVLGDITVDGKKIKAVMASNKTGFLYVFDRVTGNPVWPIEERPVPKSTIPGEETWPTQPFPTKPPAFDRQGSSEDDLIDYTPELHKQPLEIASHYVMGPLFTPPIVRSSDPDGKRGTLEIPGGWGAANWNTGAFDPETGMYYAISQTEAGGNGLTRNPDPENPMLYGSGPLPRTPEQQAQDAQQGRGGQGRRQQGGQGRGQQGPGRGNALSIDGLPIYKGPYGRITALDLNHGTLAWMVPNGDGSRNHPLLKGLNVPPLGTFMLAPYTNIPSRGKPNYTAEDFNRIIGMMDRRGWQIMVHAIGDGAVRMTLDGFEKLALDPMPARAAGGIGSSISRPSIRRTFRVSGNWV